jgi:glutathione synthase/RimK-type ligase-like ATP-grasp enzyme
MNAGVAILSERIDQHASAVQWALTRNGIPSFVVPDVNAFAKRVSIHANEDGLAWRTYGADAHAMALRSVWFRRPKPPEPGHCLEEDKQFLSQQLKLFQKNVFDLDSHLIDALWINRPTSALLTESKLLQLREAQAVGLAFPEMVVTNRAEDVAQLIKRWGRVVYKSFYPHTWHSASQNTYHSVGVVLLDEHSELSEASIAMCPGIFQRYIDKKLDIRVTVVGDRMFAVEILKQNGGAFLDWRTSVSDDESVMKPCRLDQALEQKIRALMSRLGIVFGCIDLVVDRDNNVFFLEVNQAGQFLFVEDKVREVPLLQAVTAMLAEGRCDYSMDSHKPVRLAEYLASDEYQQAAQSNDQPLAALSEER